MKNKTTTYLILLFSLLLCKTNYAQLNYLPGGFAILSRTYVDLGTNGTPIITPNNDDAFSAPQPIGFTFTFNGFPYDSFVLSTNGFIKLGRDSASRHFLFTTHAQPPANGVFTAATSPTPLVSDSSMLFAFGQNLVAHPNAQPYSMETSGSFGSRVCTIQWKNVKDTLQGGVAGLWDTINFQIKLYETSNVVEFVYGRWTSTVSNPVARFSAVGIVGRSVTIANQNLHLVKGSTVGWNGSVANTGFYVNNAVNYRNPTSTPAGPAPASGLVYSFTPIVANDASVRAVYSQGRIALPFYLADSIRANISNPGTNTITNLTVTLDITGANTYSTTANIASLAPGANTTVSFAPFTPTNIGNSLVTVSVPFDDNNANNTATYGMSVGSNRMAYTDTTQGVTGSNGTTIPNFWGARYFVHGSGLVTTVRAFLVANSEALGDTVCGIVMDSTGLILGRSPNYIVQTSDLGSTLVFNISVPPLVNNKSIIAGIAGGTSVTGLNYFLGTSQTEVPMRQNPPFYFMSQSLAGGVTNANVGSIYANPVVWTTTRLMMECSIVPLPQVDVSAQATFPIQNAKIPVQVNVPLRVVIKNTGLQTRTAGIPVYYKVGNAPAVGPVLTTVSLSPNDTTTVLFSGNNALNFPTQGNYSLKVYTALSGDSLRYNDTLDIVYTAQPATTIPYRITDNILNNWTAENPVSFGNPMWAGVSATMPNGNVSANVLRAGNINLTTGLDGKVISPMFNLNGVSNPVLHFYVAHAPNTLTSLDDTLQVLVSVNGGYTYTPVWTRSSHNTSPRLGTDTASATAYIPNFANDWRYESVDLSSFSGQSNVVFAFRNKAAGGNNVYINNVTLTNPNSVSVQPVFSTGTFFNTNASLTLLNSGAANGEIIFSQYNTAPFSDAIPAIATNTTATTNNSAIFTPNNTSINNWNTITYSGVGTGNLPQSVTYTVSFTTSLASGIVVADSVYILRRANYNAPWQAIPTTFSSGIYTSGVLSGFADFTLGSLSSVNPLPVKWLSIQAQRIHDKKHLINWATASEINSDVFIIERSNDMINFIEIGKVKAIEALHNNYQFEDEVTAPFVGTTYYRIKQIDKDGSFGYSIVVEVKNMLNTNDVVVVNPFETNPVIIYTNQNEAKDMAIRLMDISGKVLVDKIVDLQPGTNRLEVMADSPLSAGVYFISMKVNQTEWFTRKLIKY